ncbi:MAG: RluA family pseudouridine synthase [Solirubrobacterales bacterium]
MADPQQTTVPVADAGQRLDRWIASAGLAGSRSEAQRRIAAGQVTVDGAQSKPSRPLEGGEVIEVVASDPAPAAPAAGPAPEELVVARDDAVIVVDKPAGLLVHPASGRRETTLVDLFAAELAGGEADRPGVVHRLDRGTSGLMLLARTPDAHRSLVAQLAARTVQRRYLALVRGRPASRTGTVDAPIGRDTLIPSQMAIGGRGERSAVTHFEVVETLREHTLLRVRLETGRTHQIRVHLAAIGLPVAGDQTYGQNPGELGLGRQFLHSDQLRFEHPADGVEHRHRSTLPTDLGAALATAGGQPPPADPDSPGPAAGSPPLP